MNRRRVRLDPRWSVKRHHGDLRLVPLRAQQPLERLEAHLGAKEADADQPLRSTLFALCGESNPQRLTCACRASLRSGPADRYEPETARSLALAFLPWHTQVTRARLMGSLYQLYKLTKLARRVIIQ